MGIDYICAKLGYYFPLVKKLRNPPPPSPPSVTGIRPPPPPPSVTETLENPSDIVLRYSAGFK